MNKSRAQRSHAKRRFYERFGILLNRKDRQNLINQIQGNRAKFVEKESNRVSLWDVMVKGKIIRVVYDKDRKNIVTALPQEADDETISWFCDLDRKEKKEKSIDPPIDWDDVKRSCSKISGR